MSTEIEVKILEVDSQLENRVCELGAQLQWSELMTTIIYDFPDRRLVLSGGYVRVRNEDGQWWCTYKGKKDSSSRVKIMNEFNLQSSSQEAAEQFLQALGLQRRLHLEKKRSHYTWGNFCFDFDTLPGIPTYMEIEAPSTKEIEEILEKLAIPQAKSNTMGAKQLLNHYGIDMDEITEMLFDSP